MSTLAILGTDLGQVRKNCKRYFNKKDKVNVAYFTAY